MPKPIMVRTSAHCLTKSGKKHLFIPCFTEGKDMTEMFLVVLWSVGRKPLGQEPGDLSGSC